MLLQISRAIVAVATALSLTACLAPQDFEAELHVRSDGSVTYRYTGTAVHVFAAAALREKGALSAQDEAGLRAFAEKARRAPGVRSLQPLGAGRFAVRIEQTLAGDVRVGLLDLFSLRTTANGQYVVAAPAVPRQDLADVRSLDIRTEGRVKVFLPANARVLAHNASQVPSAPSGAYGWEIRSVDDALFIEFALPAA